MHFQRVTVVSLVIVAGIAGAISATSTKSAQAANGGLAYNEVVRFVSSNTQPAPQPGNFAADYQAAVDGQKATASGGQHHGLFGGISNMVDLAKGAMNMFKVGTPSSKYYLNGWERTDDPGAQTATIQRPDLHQIIYLNLAKKTYHVVDTSVQPMTETPPPYQPPSRPNEPPPSPQPGTCKLDISVSSSSLGAKQIDNVSTTGYNTAFKMQSTQATGSCVNGGFQTTMVEYVSPYDEPSAGSPHGKPSMSMTTSHPEAMGVKPGCKPKITMHHAMGASAPGGKLAMWEMITLSGSAQTSQGSMGGGFSTLIERGSVRTLGSGDKGLFEIPAGFTKEVPTQ